MRAIANDAQPRLKVLHLRRRFPFEDGFRLQEGRTATAEQVIQQLERFVIEERMARMRQARACTPRSEPQALVGKAGQDG